MKPEIKKLWTDALRSGKYQQGTGYLNRDGKLCCLGVLCELAVQAGVAKLWGPPLPLGSSFSYGGLESSSGSTTGLPDGVCEWAGVLEGDQPNYAGRLPHTRDTSEPYSLAEANDERQMTFSQIADLIDKHF